MIKSIISPGAPRLPIEIEAEIAALLEYDTDYIEQIRQKHFDRDKATGSLFLDVADPKNLLKLAYQQRGSLEGDDRNHLRSPHDNDSTFLEDVRYIAVATKGLLGVIDYAKVSPATQVRISKVKEGDAVTLVLQSKVETPETNIATIVIGKDNGADELWTCFPGKPGEGTLITELDIDSAGLTLNSTVSAGFLAQSLLRNGLKTISFQVDMALQLNDVDQNVGV